MRQSLDDTDSSQENRPTIQNILTTNQSPKISGKTLPAAPVEYADWHLNLGSPFRMIQDKVETLTASGSRTPPAGKSRTGKVARRKRQSGSTVSK